MIKDMKGQLATALRNGGFLSSGSPSDPAANKNSGLCCCCSKCYIS